MVPEVYFDAYSYCDKITGNCTVALINDKHTEPFKVSLICIYDRSSKENKSNEVNQAALILTSARALFCRFPRISSL